MSLSDRWAEILDELQRQGRHRALIPPSGVDFTSNDYLGYGNGARGPFAVNREEARKSLSTSGMASRLLRGHHPLWEEVETRLAQWHHADAVLMMTSGYAANEGLLSTVIEPQDWVASDQCNHASIIDGLRLARAERFVYPHLDLDQLESGLKTAAKTRSQQCQLFVVTESLFSMEGDRAPLRELAQLAERFAAALIVDEAHATGCFGPNGSGLVDELGLRDRVLATVHTGGKALGVPGAYICCGSPQLKELLVNRCRQLIFTTALPPAVAAWWLEMLPFVETDDAGRQALLDKAGKFRDCLGAQGIAALGRDYIVPIILGPDRLALEAAAGLQKQGFDIRAIRPPTVPPGSSRLRLSIHADHDSDTLEKAARAVTTAVQQARNQ